MEVSEALWELFFRAESSHYPTQPLYFQQCRVQNFSWGEKKSHTVKRSKMAFSHARVHLRLHRLLRHLRFPQSPLPRQHIMLHLRETDPQSRLIAPVIERHHMVNVNVLVDDHKQIWLRRPTSQPQQQHLLDPETRARGVDDFRRHRGLIQGPSVVDHPRGMEDGRGLEDDPEVGQTVHGEARVLADDQEPVGRAVGEDVDALVVDELVEFFLAAGEAFFLVGVFRFVALGSVEEFVLVFRLGFHPLEGGFFRFEFHVDGADVGRETTGEDTTAVGVKSDGDRVVDIAGIDCFQGI